MNAPDRILATAPADPAAVLSRYYRGHARLYDATRWSFLFGRAALIRSLACLSPPPRNILEIGCGTGSNLLRLVRQFPEAAVTGLDLSADMLARARRKLEKDQLPVTLLHQRYDRPLYPEPVFDLIVFSYCLTMINPGWERAVDAALRDLRPGGSAGGGGFPRYPLCRLPALDGDQPRADGRSSAAVSGRTVSAGRTNAEQRLQRRLALLHVHRAPARPVKSWTLLASVPCGFPMSISASRNAKPSSCSTFCARASANGCTWWAI
jgi:ubiquinone/menaquinone biosynthesis C-methylase UbiE